ncbi:MAG TPA: hypothetical protein VN901_22920 [Candidatus Acidoferrales bacterium]|nr:hypothetical protein [Candidatus Acidoferrales bacterium]
MSAEAIAESEKVLQTMPDSSVGLTELAYSLAAGGRQPEARRILQHLEEKSKRDFVPAYNFAVVHLALNEQDKALYFLQRAYKERDWALMVLAVEPRLDSLRSDPRFAGVGAEGGPATVTLRSWVSRSPSVESGDRSSCFRSDDGQTASNPP